MIIDVNKFNYFGIKLQTIRHIISGNTPLPGHIRAKRSHHTIELPPAFRAKGAQSRLGFQSRPVDLS